MTSEITQRFGWALMVGASLLGGCREREATAPVDASVRRDAGQRPRLPQLSVRFDGPPPDCFPVGFRATRVRPHEAALELCGLTTTGRTRCYHIDPVANTVRRADVADAPTTMPTALEVAPPLQRVEVATRGARASLRAGTLTVTGLSGQVRTLTSRQMGFHSLDGVVLAPVSDGYFVAALGTRSDDLGASVVADPATLNVITHSANLPCQGNAE